MNFIILIVIYAIFFKQAISEFKVVNCHVFSYGMSLSQFKSHSVKLNVIQMLLGTGVTKNVMT